MKEYFTRHVLLCESLSKTKRERDRENEEYGDTPSHRELYLLVQELAFKYEKLQGEYDVLSKWVGQKKRLMNVVDWLKMNLKLDITFLDWLSQIKLTHTHLEYVFKFDYIEGINYILQDICSVTNEQLPIKAFTQKENIFFVYMKNEINEINAISDKTDKTENNATHHWEQITKEHFNKLIGIISKGIINLFKDWQDANIDKMTDDAFSTLYVENLKKVMGGSMPMEIQNNKIRNKFFKYYKVNLKMTHFEIE
jgi:hypothetical protein